MADRNYEVSLILGMVDKASEGLNSFTKSIDDTRKTLEVTSTRLLAFGGSIAGALGLCVKAAADNETAYNKLAYAVNMTGKSWEESKPAVDKFVNSMRSATAVSDEDLAGAMTRMITYTGDVDKAMRGAKIAVDMAASGMFDMDGAARLVGMAMNGNVEMLGRYIPQLKAGTNSVMEHMTASEKAEYALKLLQEKFGGMAANELNTFNGKMKDLKDEVGELMEDIGTVLLPILKRFADTTMGVVGQIRDWSKAHPELLNALVSTAGQVAAVALGLGGLIKVVLALKTELPLLRAAMMAMPWAAAAAAVAALTIGILNLLNAQADERNANINTAKTHEGMIKKLNEEANALRSLMWETNLSTEKRAEAQEKLNSIEKAIAKEKIALAAQTNQKLVAEETKKNKALLAAEQTKNVGLQLEKQKKNEADLEMENQQWEAINAAVAVSDEASLKQREIQDAAITAAEKKMLEQDKADKAQRIANAQMLTNLTSNIITNFASYESQVISNRMNNDLRASQSTYEGKKRDILNNVKDEKERDRQLGELEKNYNAETNNIKERARQQDLAARKKLKPFMIAEAVANVAVGVAKSLANPWPMNLVAAALTFAAGAIQIATIRAQQFAQGVSNFSGGMAWVGEKGPELLNLPAGTSVYSNAQSMAMAGGGGMTFNINVTGNQILNDRAVNTFADRISDVIMTRVRNNRNI